MIVLFGAAGYVGRHVRAALGPQGDVVAVPRARLDLAACPPAELTGLMYEVAPDVIVNCAGATTGDAATLTRDNVVAVARLLAAVAVAAPRARVVQIGSSAEYGRVPMGPPTTEDAPCDPIGPYALTKLAATELVRAAARDGMNATVLRLFNVIGPGAPPGSLPMKLALTLRDGGDLVVGGQDVYRDFLDVRDAATAVALAARADRPLPPVLNIGSGRATPVPDLLTTLVEVARPGARILPAAGGPPAVPWQCADITRATTALGWQPRTTLRACLEAVWSAVCLPDTAPATGAPWNHPTRTGDQV
ncbi:NAD-dependent epimerase/dehydratase family protein [Nonomuraea typhae]|uniref:NAD-dependent epimerase/dehydratase family protein n=1 Tax=Nonomuraea typhae TaxID=2603600 RepID=UPI0012FC3258|nr:NAD(P)-dependent oxidoreductase [Nonomuraea typhae]